MVSLGKISLKSSSMAYVIQQEIGLRGEMNNSSTMEPWIDQRLVRRDALLKEILVVLKRILE
ncbi:hypothetical protein TIFTF001_054790, partial [Ficus carica]